MNAPDRKRRAVAPTAVSHDGDFHAWTVEQSTLLAARNVEALDWDNLAEEIAGLGRSEKREIESRLAVLLLHLLKWRHQPELRCGSWRATIREQRIRIARELQASPSLRDYPAGVLADEYAGARIVAADQTERPAATFPAACPFTIDEVLDPDFLPAAPAA